MTRLALSSLARPYARLACLALSGALAIGLAGCAHTPVEKAEADMATMQAETSKKNLVDRGRAFAAVGDLTRAEEYLAAAIDQGAHHKDVLPLLLDVCVRGGRYRSAIQHAENHLRRFPHDHGTRLVVEARPDDAQAHYVLAVVARDDEDVIGADRHFREYLRLQPTGTHAEEARASLLRRMP